MPTWYDEPGRRGSDGNPALADREMNQTQQERRIGMNRQLNWWREGPVVTARGGDRGGENQIRNRQYDPELDVWYGQYTAADGNEYTMYSANGEHGSYTSDRDEVFQQVSQRDPQRAKAWANRFGYEVDLSNARQSGAEQTAEGRGDQAKEFESMRARGEQRLETEARERRAANGNQNNVSIGGTEIGKDTQVGETTTNNTLSPGTSGPEVEEAQRMLVGLGYDLGTFGANSDGIDGEYGDVTTEAVRTFQRSQGLPQSGELNDQTMAALQDRANAQGSNAFLE